MPRLNLILVPVLAALTVLLPPLVVFAERVSITSRNIERFYKPAGGSEVCYSAGYGASVRKGRVARILVGRTDVGFTRWSGGKSLAEVLATTTARLKVLGARLKKRSLKGTVRAVLTKEQSERTAQYVRLRSCAVSKLHLGTVVEWEMDPAFPRQVVAGAAWPPLKIYSRDFAGRSSLALDGKSGTLRLAPHLSSHPSMGAGPLAALPRNVVAAASTSAQSAVRNGVLPFVGLSISAAGSMQLSLSVGGEASTSLPAITVLPASGAELRLDSELPTSATSSQLLPTLTVTLRDQFGNLATTTNPVVVTAKVLMNSAEVVASGTALAVNGVAQFTKLRLPSLGATRLSFEAPGYPTILSDPINVVGRVSSVLASNSYGVENFSNFSPTFRVLPWELASEGATALARRAAIELQKAPPGEAVIYFQEEFYRTLYNYGADVFLRTPAATIPTFTDPDGVVHPYEGIWWDPARMAYEQGRIRSFLLALKAVGAPVDYAWIDFEEEGRVSSMVYGLPYGGDTNTLGNSVATVNRARYFTALEADPRFSNPAFGLSGISLRDALGFPVATTISSDPYGNGAQAARVLAAMGQIIRNQLRSVFFDPMSEVYPLARTAAYNYADFCVDPNCAPDGGANIYRRNLSETIAPTRSIGTNQNPEIYADINNLALFHLDERGLTWGDPVSNPPYEASPFNAFRLGLNRMISFRVSSSTPVTPFIRSRRDRQDDEVTPLPLTESDYYQEMILHLLMQSPDHILYFNPGWPAVGTPEYNLMQSDYQVLSNLLGEFDRQAGYSATQVPLTNGLVDWTKPYVVTGVQLEGKQLYRFSPKLGSGVSRESVLVSEFPATFNVAGENFTLPGGRVVRPLHETGPLGFWIVRGED